jgi:UDP-N-acetyl-D-mannosaminuronic acid dehydrogenase
MVETTEIGNSTIAIVECGKLGIPHAKLFAKAGFNVICANSNPHMLKQLARVRSRLLEEDSQFIKRNGKDDFFKVLSNVREAVTESNIVVVSTRSRVDKKKRSNYSSLENTCKEVGMGLKKDSLVLFVAQTGPGIVEDSMCPIIERASGLKVGDDFGLASSPFKVDVYADDVSEVSKRGRVVGAFDKSSLQRAKLILSRIHPDVVEVSSIRLAEVLGLFKEVKKEVDLAVANEFAMICEKFDVDFIEVLRAAAESKAFSLPSPDLVDDSIRKDYDMLLFESDNVNLNPRLLTAAGKLNDNMVNQIYRLIKETLRASGKTVRRAKVSIIGISQKPNLKVAPGDSRKKFVNFLKKKVRTALIYDPFFSSKELAELGFEAADLSRTVERTDCLVVLVAHDKFERLNLKRINLLAKKSPAIVDVVHIIDPARAEKYGFIYRSLGSCVA